MKTREEEKERINYLIKRKERIRVKHLLAIKKHLQDVKDCETYIAKHKEKLEKMMSE